MLLAVVRDNQGRTPCGAIEVEVEAVEAAAPVLKMCGQ